MDLSQHAGKTVMLQPGLGGSGQLGLCWLVVLVGWLVLRAQVFCLLVGLCTICVQDFQRPLEVPWNWSYWPLRATRWMLQIDSRSLQEQPALLTLGLDLSLLKEWLSPCWEGLHGRTVVKGKKTGKPPGVWG